MSCRPATGFAVLALSLSPFASPAAAGHDRATRAAVEAVADRALSANGASSGVAPGCAIRVSHRGETLLAKAYGYADLEREVPFGLQTVSEAGSVAKQFMAAQVLLLAEGGRLSLDDDIRKYLPEMPDYGAPIRIYDLLHQLSGVREYSTLAALRGYPRFYRTLYDLDTSYGLIASQRTLNFAPGSRYEYSNSNYVLLTLIVQRVSGMSAAEFGRRRLFEPLGMGSTQWRDDARRLVARRALAYRKAAAGYELFMPTENTFGHGALLTTVGDLERWNTALVSGGLSPFVTRHLVEPGRLRGGGGRAYGAGIVLGERRGHRVYRHGGVTAGYNAQLWVFPDDRLSIALLCNARAGDLGDLAGRAADAALGLPPLPLRAAPAAATPAPERPEFYRAENGEMLAIGAAAGVTSVDLFASVGPIALTGPDDDLSASTPLGRMEVRRDGADRLDLRLEDRDPTTFFRLPPAPPRALPLGRYVSRDLGAAFVLSQAKDGYRLDLDDARAPDPIGFRLEWLTGDAYRARIETRGGYMRDDMVVGFAARAGQPPMLTMSSVAGLQAVDLLEFQLFTDEPAVVN